VFAPRALLAAIVILGVLLPPQFALAARSASAPRAAVGDQAAPVAGAADTATNQLLIGFAPGTTATERDAAVARRGGRIIRTFESIDALLIAVPAGRAAASDFAADTVVRYAELNAPIHPARIPDDPDYANSGLWGLGKIDAPTAWDTATGGSGVVVGVVDSGIDYTHPDLAANVWTAPPGWDVDGCGAGTHGYRADPGVTNCDPLDEYGHGTHVAGTIGATGDDGRGIVGVDWRVTLMPLRFMAANGAGDTAGAIAAIDYAVQAKQRGVNVRVLNLSWTTESSIFVQALYDELKVASDNGILIVAAAGNTEGNSGTDNGATPTYPANFATQVPGDPFAAAIPNMIAVAASDRSDTIATFDGYASNYSAARVQLAAPGVDVYSTIPGYNTFLFGETKNYDTLSGTSMATPHVSGAAALLLSASGFRDLTATQLRDRLLGCGDRTSGLSGKVANGRLNVARALRGTSGCAATPTYALTLSAGSGGTATVAPTPGPYPVGTTVAISAQPQAGYGLTGWTIDGVASADLSNPLNLTMNVPHTVAATFVANNAAPQIGTLSPTMIPAGSGRFVLTVNGSGFARGAVVKWNGTTTLATSFVNSTQLQAIVPDTLVANQGSATVVVSNPTPGGGLTSTNFAIGTAEQSISFDPLPSRQLGASPFTVTASAIGAPLTFSATGACAVGATTTAGTATTATVTLTDLGDCGLTATQTGGGASTPASMTRHFTVIQGVPTITWANPAAITYGTALDATILNATVTASIPGTFRYAPASGAVLPAGEHTLTVTFAPADTTHYATITRAVPLIVAKAPLIVTAHATDGIYGQPLTPFTATYSGFVNGDTAQRTLDGALTFATSATDRSPVGQYPVTPGGLAAANYALTFAAATLRIAPAPLTVTANDRARPTGVADPTFAVTYSGFIPGEDRQALGGTLACTTPAATTSPVGTYPITCGGLTTTNYILTYRPGTLTIVNAQVALNVLPMSATVGQQSATLVARIAAQSAAAPSGTVTFTVTQGATVIGTPTDAPIGSGEASASFPITTLAAGDYTVTARIEASGGNPAVSGSGMLTIARQSQALTFAAPATHHYGDAVFALNATASSGLAVAFSVPADGPCSLAGTTVRLDRAGICTVTATQPGDAATLPAAPVARSFTIVRGASSLRWDTPASIVYGTPLGATQLAATADSAGVITYDPPPGAILGAGAHTLTAYFTPTASDTFASASAMVTITVTPAPLMLTALDATITYGVPLPAFAVEVRGLVNGDTATSLGVGANPAASASAPLPVAPYALAPAATTGGNYTITTNAGSLIVLPRPLTLTASDATRAYGANNPAFDLRYDGFADGESAASLGLTPTCAPPADGTSQPGTYPLVCRLSAPANYRVRSLPGTLTVTPAPQSLAFTAPADRMLSATTGTLAATASSGLPVTFVVAPGSPCVVSGTTLTLLSVGPCVITARQGGDARYAVAPELARTVQILPLPAPPAPSPTPTPIPPPTATPIPPPPPPPPPTVAPPPKSCAQTAAVTVAKGSGTVSPTTVCVGVPTALTASPGNRQLFIGWAIDGTVQSYTNPIQLTLTSGHTITARFGPTQDFPDLTASAMKDAIDQLAARGIVKGYADGSFGPRDTTLRAQMAALIGRAMGWEGEDHGNPFSDRGVVDDELWRAVGTLAHYEVAHGYGDGTYGTLDPVLQVQTVAFIARAMVRRALWAWQPDDATLFPAIPASSGHRVDLATYAHYVGSPPDTDPTGAWASWDTPATRGWFARALWQALDGTYGTPHTP
jgi:subtilisin family serine protease